jgi:hypothetical protein
MKGRDHFGRPRYRWDDTMKIDAKEIGCGLDLSRPK